MCIEILNKEGASIIAYITGLRTKSMTMAIVLLQLAGPLKEIYILTIIMAMTLITPNKNISLSFPSLFGTWTARSICISWNQCVNPWVCLTIPREAR